MKYLTLATCLLAIASGCSKRDFPGPDEATLNALDPEERILLAVRTGDIASLESVVQEHPDIVHEVSSSGQTLLHHAVMVSQVEVIQYLLGHGADPNALNMDDDTALDLARDVGADPEVSKVLRDAGGY